jgi:hypothetical protein
VATWEPLVQRTKAKPYAPNYFPCSGSIRGLNSIVYPQLPHITGTTAEPSTGAPSAVSGSGVEMITCSGPTENCPWEQTRHPPKPLETRHCSIRSLLCCCASEGMLLPLSVLPKVPACYRLELSAVLVFAGVVPTSRVGRSRTFASRCLYHRLHPLYRRGQEHDTMISNRQTVRLTGAEASARWDALLPSTRAFVGAFR